MCSRITTLVWHIVNLVMCALLYGITSASYIMFKMTETLQDINIHLEYGGGVVIFRDIYLGKIPPYLCNYFCQNYLLFPHLEAPLLMRVYRQKCRFSICQHRGLLHCNKPSAIVESVKPSHAKLAQQTWRPVQLKAIAYPFWKT